MGWPASTVFTSAGTRRIEARNASTGKLVAAWDAPDEVASLAFDPDTSRLLVGMQSTGTIATFDLIAFLAQQGERAPPPASVGLETGMEGVLQILAPTTEGVLAIRGPEVAVLERVTGAELSRREMTVDAISYVAAVAGDDPVTARLIVLDAGAGMIQTLEGTTLTTQASQTRHPRRSDADDERARHEPADLGSGRSPAGHGRAPGDHRRDQHLPRRDHHPDATVPLSPARPSGWDPVANLVYAAGDSAVWVIEPHGDSRSGYGVYDEVDIGGEPRPASTSATRPRPMTTASSSWPPATPALVRIDISQNAMAWRFAATIFGALLAGLVYILTAMLFRRRSIAILAGVFVAIDLMSFAMSRIAMNDIFVALFIVAGYALFWPIWGGRWARSAWWVLPLAVMIGLAAASKWVGWYALIGLWFLVLLRSQLGRFLVIGAIGFGAIAIGIPGPWPFLLIALGTLASAWPCRG